MSAPHPLDNYIQDIVDKALSHYDTSIKKEDATAIINEIEPIIDNIVSKRIKQHLKILANFMLASIQPKGEKPGNAKNT